MNLKLYALFDDEEKRFFNLGLGIQDEDFSKWIVKQLQVAVEHIKPDDVPLFVKKVRSCQVYRLAEVDELTGEVSNCKQFLVDLKGFEVKSDENGKE